MADWLEFLAAAREQGRSLVELGAPQLARPSLWAGHKVDVRFRLHRFASHLVEHTIHAEKLLAALSQPPTQAHPLVRRISAVRGAHEWLSAPTT